MRTCMHTAGCSQQAMCVYRLLNNHLIVNKDASMLAEEQAHTWVPPNTLCCGLAGNFSSREQCGQT